MSGMPSSQLSPSVEETSTKKINMLKSLLKDLQNNPISQQSPNPVPPTPAQSIGTTTLKVHNQQVTQQPCTSSSSITNIANTTEEGSINMMNIDHISDSQRQGTTWIQNSKPAPIIPPIDHASLIKDIVSPLVKEVCGLKDSVQTEYSRLQSNYSTLEGIITNQQQTINKLESTITTNQRETTADLTDKMSANTERINTYMVEN